MFSALKRTAILLSAILLMAMAWGIGRMPGAGLVPIVFTGLVSALLADVKSFRVRLKKAAVLACYSAAAQFLFAVSGELPFYQLLISAAFAYFVFSTLPDCRAGCIVLLTGFLGSSAAPGFLPAVSRSIDILTGVIVVMAVTTPGAAGIKEENHPSPALCSPYQALVLSAEIGIGYAVSKILQLQQGTWIMLTILFINMSKTSDSPGEKLAWQRIWAVPAGIVIGGFLLGTFYQIDYRFIWLLPFIGTIGFFILYNSGNFFLFSIIFMITLTFFADWLTGDGNRFNFWNNFFARTAATWIGAVIELLAGYSRKYEKGEVLQ